jgi:hypothetical protein
MKLVSKSGRIIFMPAVVLLVVIAFVLSASFSKDKASLSGGMRDSSQPGDELLQSLRSQLAEFQIRPDIDSVVLALSGDYDPIVKAICIMYLGYAGSESELESIAGFINAPEHFLRLQAINSLNLIITREKADTSKTFKPLLSRMKKTAEEIYKGASNILDSLEVAGLLCRLGDASRWSVVYETLAAKNPNSVGIALSLLPCFIEYEKKADTQLVDWVPPLTDIALDKRSPVTHRLPAVLSLIQINTARARSALTKVLQVEADSTVRQVIKSGLDVRTLRKEQNR